MNSGKMNNNKDNFDQDEYNKRCVSCGNTLRTEDEYFDEDSLCEDCQGRKRCEYCETWTRKWNWINGLMICEDCEPLNIDANDLAIFRKMSKAYESMKDVSHLLKMYKRFNVEWKEHAKEINGAADYLANWMEAIRKQK